MKFKLVENYLLEYNQNQINAFNDKFGEGSYNYFMKSQQRLKNAGEKTDLVYYLKDASWNHENLYQLLDRLDSEVSAKRGRYSDAEMRNKVWKPEGEYEHLGRFKNWDAYMPLDVDASISMGVNTGWCTTGRYGHAGHPEFIPSREAAEEHWNNYTWMREIEFINLLNPKTHYGEYSIAIHPDVEVVDEEYGLYCIKESNVEIYNAKDDLDFSILSQELIDWVEEQTDIKIVVSVEKLQPIEIDRTTLVKYRKNDTYFKIPDGIELIGNGVFRDCTSLKRITIPNSVTEIGDYAFTNCKSLQEIIIPNSVTEIGYWVFDGCKSLKKITIPNSVTEIGYWVFYGCKSLKEIHIPDSVTKIGNNAFNYCESLKEIIIPDSVIRIGDNAFNYCKSLTEIVIPDSVIRIGDNVFKGCPNLTIKCHPNSYAEKCAIEDGIKVEYI